MMRQHGKSENGRDASSRPLIRNVPQFEERFHRQCPIGKRFEHSLVARPQGDGQSSSEPDELGVVRSYRGVVAPSQLFR